jgi:hypothetical protein
MKNPLESELERLARTLTEQFGIQVLCQGDQAWTDGSRIVVPSVPEPMDETLEQMMLAQVSLVHVGGDRTSQSRWVRLPICIGFTLWQGAGVSCQGGR